MPLTLPPPAAVNIIDMWSGTPNGTKVLRDDGALVAPSGFSGNTVTVAEEVTDYVVQDDDAHIVASVPLSYITLPDAAPANRGRVVAATIPTGSSVYFKTVGGTTTHGGQIEWQAPYTEVGSRTVVLMSLGDPSEGWGVLASWDNAVEYQNPFQPNLENSTTGSIIMAGENGWEAVPFPAVQPPGRVATEFGFEEGTLEADLFELNCYQLHYFMGKLTVWVKLLDTMEVGPDYDYVLQCARTTYSVNLLVAEDGSQTLDLTEIAAEVDSMTSAGTISLEVTAVQTPHPYTGSAVLHLEVTTDQVDPSPDGWRVVEVIAHFEDPFSTAWVDPAGS